MDTWISVCSITVLNPDPQSSGGLHPWQVREEKVLWQGGCSCSSGEYHPIFVLFSCCACLLQMFVSKLLDRQRLVSYWWLNTKDFLSLLVRNRTLLLESWLLRVSAWLIPQQHVCHPASLRRLFFFFFLQLLTFSVLELGWATNWSECEEYFWALMSAQTTASHWIWYKVLLQPVGE